MSANSSDGLHCGPGRPCSPLSLSCLWRFSFINVTVESSTTSESSPPTLLTLLGSHTDHCRANDPPGLDFQALAPGTFRTEEAFWRKSDTSLTDPTKPSCSQTSNFGQFMMLNILRALQSATRPESHVCVAGSRVGEDQSMLTSGASSRSGGSALTSAAPSFHHEWNNDHGVPAGECLLFYHSHRWVRKLFVWHGDRVRFSPRSCDFRRFRNSGVDVWIRPAWARPELWSFCPQVPGMLRCCAGLFGNSAFALNEY